MLSAPFKKKVTQGKDAEKHTNIFDYPNTS